MTLTSSNNAKLFNDCKSLQNLTVTLQVEQDLITLGNNGFSLQLNCYPQTNPQSTYRDKPLEWIQYVIAVDNNSVQWGIQYWSTVKGFGFSPADNYSSFASVSSNQVPKGSLMRIALHTPDSNGNVASATFSITDPGGKVSQFTFSFPSNALCAIYGFQVNVVGPPVGTHNCTFTWGAGILDYSVSSGTLAVQNTNTCGGPQLGTGETSNAVYGDVTPASGPKVSQKLTTGTPLTPNEALTKMRFIIGTGGDDLRSDSTATADVFLKNGGQFTETLHAKNSGDWGNGSSQGPIDFEIPNTVTLPTTKEGLSGVRINLIQGGSWPETDDNWDISTLLVGLFNPGSVQACQLSLHGISELQDGSTGLVRLSGSAGSSGSGPSSPIFKTGAGSGC